jgi:O-6-methylguanine DNA methyltransferase
MRQPDESLLAAQRRLVRDLRALGAEDAPPDLLPAVLARLGLADAYWTVDSPVGPVFVAHNAAGISAVMLADSAVDFATRFRRRFARRVRPLAAPPRDLAERVARQLRGARPGGLRFDLRGLGEFERAVLLKALEIPRGEVRPYAWVAREIGRPAAVRAVGTALARNPIPLLIPCHRVVRSDGTLGLYSLGEPGNKRLVLDAEGADPAELERLAHAGVRFAGSDTTHVYCFPSCRHARRVADVHRVTFHSAEAAVAAGYRPCTVCRPGRAS